MGTKLNPGKFDCYASALPDEPNFTVLARDPDAPDTVEEWAKKRHSRILSGEKPMSDLALVEEARECARDMRDWRDINEGAWRLPILPVAHDGNSIHAHDRAADDGMPLPEKVEAKIVQAETSTIGGDTPGVDQPGKYHFLDHDDEPYSGKARYPFLALTTMAREFKENSTAHGFNDPPQTLDQTLLLIISEVIEIFEDTRKGIERSEKLPGFSIMEEECSDIIIRVLDQSAVRGLRIAEAVQAKHEYNKGRPYKHGKKF